MVEGYSSEAGGPAEAIRTRRHALELGREMYICNQQPSCAIKQKEGAMRTKGFRLVTVLFALFCIVGTSWGAGEDTPYPIMRPDHETFLRWVHMYETAPLAPIDPQLAATIPPQGSLSLLSYISYVPSERNQGSCGNCWVWAGTGVMEIDLYRQLGIKNRLSTQFLNSCDTPYACCGGWLSDVAGFYASKTYAIPWANPNAQFQDAGKTCASGASARSCSSIDTATQYPVTSITDQTISVRGNQATAISNIKNVLSQNKGVGFAFFLATTADWNAFFSFWSNQDESAVFNYDSYCGHTTDSGYGGHLVLLVGYNDDDPNNKYWIALNSWGSSSNRPNGLFRFKMDMNYDCYFKDGGSNYYSHYFNTLSIAWGSTEWETAYQNLLASPADLAILRSYRDNVLGRNVAGKEVSRLLYQNSQQALWVLLSNPELMDWAARLIQNNKEAVADAESFGEGVIADTDDVLAFLQAFARKSPPALRVLADSVRGQMIRKRANGEPFFGLDLK